MTCGKCGIIAGVFGLLTKSVYCEKCGMMIKK